VNRLFSRLKSVRSRLLAVMLCVFTPLALASIVAATHTYRTVEKNIAASQISVASNYAVRARVWFRGILRTLVVTTAILERDVGGADGRMEDCAMAVENARSAIVGLQGFIVSFGNGVRCSSAGSPRLSEDVLSQIMERQAGSERTALWGGQDLGDARYDVTTVDGHTHLVVYVRNTSKGSDSEALVVVDPALLDVAFDIGSFELGGIVALVSRGQQVVVARGADEKDKSWLPAAEAFSPALDRARKPDRDGGSFVFVTQTVAAPDLYLLARFDNGASKAAFTQFLILCLSPIVMITLLFMAYAWAINGHVVRWINVIIQAARARRDGRSEKVVLTDAMPSDVRLLAQSFNDMVTDADGREMALRASFEANQYLLREFNHRVKNSLQVIQSYLALSRRLNKRNTDRHLVETEAKVQVLSTAYRLALLEGSMRPVPLAAFAQEILSNLSTSLRRKSQWVDVQIDAEAGLIVDRTIPIGLALVESVAAGLFSEKIRTVHVTIKGDEEGYIEMSVCTDGAVDIQMPPPKIMSGLALQIGATVLPDEPNCIFRWRFVA
jgi:two-component sensor histidine kinase